MPLTSAKSNRVERLEDPISSSVSSPHRLAARVIGVLFIAGFLFYGGGFALVSSVIGQPDFIWTLSAAQGTVVLGACLMLVNTAVDVGKGVLFFPVLERYGKRTALVYLAAVTVQVVLLAIGALFLLMLAPLGQVAADTGPEAAAWIPTLVTLLTEGNTLAYNIGQAVLSFGGVFLCALLLKTRLIPAPLAALGLGGYVLHGAGSVMELFGLSLSLILLIPGGLFEVALAFWLLTKGFNHDGRSVSWPLTAGFESRPSAVQQRRGFLATSREFALSRGIPDTTCGISRLQCRRTRGLDF